METLTRKRRNNKIRGSDVEERVAEWLLKEVPHEEIVARLDRDYGFRICRKTLHEYVKHFFKNAQNEAIQKVQETALTGVKTDTMVWARKYGDYSHYLDGLCEDIEYFQEQIGRLKGYLNRNHERVLELGSSPQPAGSKQPRVLSDRQRWGLEVGIMRYMKLIQKRRKEISDIVDGANGLVEIRTDLLKKVIGHFFQVVYPHLSPDIKNRVAEQFRLALNKV